MSGKPRRHWSTYQYRTPTPTPPWLMTWHEMVRRIELARQEPDVYDSRTAWQTPTTSTDSDARAAS